MKKSFAVIATLAMLTSCSGYREVADETFDQGWIRYQCGLYKPNFEQKPSKAVASILKEVDGVYYVGEDIKVGKYNFTLEKISDNFFKVKDKHFYLELRGELPERNVYYGILEVKPIKMQHPWKENKQYKTTAEFFHLAPTHDEK